MPLKKKSTANSSDTTTMKVSGKQTNNSPLYKLNGKFFNINKDKLLEIDKTTGDIFKLHTITSNITEILFNPNPLEKQYTEQELGQYLRILQTTGKELNNVGEKMKSILAQLNFHSKPKLKDIPSGAALKDPLVTFLPSDPGLLLNRLFILLGSQEAGNNNIRNEAISIMDMLLKQGIFDKERYSNIYNEYFS
jgi:hypothetical protein